MINFKFFACEPRVYYPLRNPYYIDNILSWKDNNRPLGSNQFSWRFKSLPQSACHQDTLSSVTWRLMESGETSSSNSSKFFFWWNEFLKFEIFAERAERSEAAELIAERAERSEAAELICHLSAWCKLYMKFHLHT